MRGYAYIPERKRPRRGGRVLALPYAGTRVFESHSPFAQEQSWLVFPTWISDFINRPRADSSP